MRMVMFGFAVAALACGPLVLAARADTTDATCEVRKNGDKQKGKSGPCTYSQRQGYIDIDLKNGDTITLNPAGGGNQYRDQNHNKVQRISSGTRSAEFRWESGKHVIVTFTGNSYGSNYNDNYNNGSYAAGKGGGYGNSYGSGKGSHGNYTVESIGNGMFEVKWPNGCIADYTSEGNNDGYTNCNEEMKRRSDEVARQRSR